MGYLVKAVGSFPRQVLTTGDTDTKARHVQCTLKADALGDRASEHLYWHASACRGSTQRSHK